MRLIRIGEPGQELPAVQVSGVHYVDVSDVVEDYNERFFTDWDLEKFRMIVEQRVDNTVVELLGQRRIGAPIARPHQILCIGLNYSDHAAETGQAVPEEPIVFTKSPNTLVGPTTASAYLATPRKPTGKWNSGS